MCKASHVIAGRRNVRVAHIRRRSLSIPMVIKKFTSVRPQIPSRRLAVGLRPRQTGYVLSRYELEIGAIPSTTSRILRAGKFYKVLSLGKDRFCPLTEFSENLHACSAPRTTPIDRAALAALLSSRHRVPCPRLGVGMRIVSCHEQVPKAVSIVEPRTLAYAGLRADDSIGSEAARLCYRCRWFCQWGRGKRNA
jgi:hypothetical protein